MATELRTKLVVEATTKGGEKVEILVDDLEQLAAAGGDAAPKFQLLAAELRALGQQQDLIAQFAALKKQTGDYAVRAEQAQEATKASALALKEKKAALATAAADEQRLTEALDRQRQVQGDIGRAVQAAKEEVRALSAASKQGGADATVYAERLADTRAQLRTLRAEYRDTGAQIKVLATEQRAASAATREIDASAKLLAVAFERSRQASGKANEAYANGRADLQRLRDTMAAAGVASGDLAASQLRIRDEMERTRAQAARVRNEYAFIGGAAEASAKKQTSSNRKITEGIRSISADLALVRNAYVGLQTAMGLGRAAKGLSDTADEVSNLQARIKLATGDGQLFGEMWRRVSDTAIRTNTSLEATGNLFARLTKVGKEAGLSTQKAAEQSLVVTETINQAIQLSGAAASASDAAVTQLIQGLQSGVLRGDEFNSVMEQAPRLAEALAKGLGVATGQLRGMAEQGDLTADKVIKALQSQARVIQEEFATLPATVGRSVQNLSSAWSLFVNQSDKATGASQLVAQSIDLLAKNLETVAAVALKAGLVVAAIYGVRALAAVRDYAAATLTAAKGLDQVAGAGGRAQAGVSGASAAMQRFGNIARGIAYAEIASQLLSIAMAYKQLREQQKAAADSQARAAELEAQKAQRLKAISDATGVVVRSMQELDAAVAAGALLFDQATSKYLTAAQAQQQLASATRSVADAAAGVDATKLVNQFFAIQAESGKTAEALKNVVESWNFEDNGSAAALTRALEALRNTGVITAQQVADAWRQALGKLSSTELVKLRDDLEEAAITGVISAQQLAQANDQVLSESFRRLGVNSAQALGKISEGAWEAIDSVGLVARTVAESGASAEEAARAIEMAFEAAAPKADSLEAIGALEKQLAVMGAAGKISAEGIERTKAALEKQRAVIEGQLPGIQSMGEALRLLGVKPQKELQALADTAKQAFEKVEASGKATPREINEAWRAMAQAAIDANGGVADAALKAEAAQHSMAIEVDDNGKAMVKSLDGAKKSADDFGEASRHAGTQAADGAAEAVDAIDEVKKAHETVTAVIEYTWLSAATQTSKYREEAAKYADQIEGQWQSMEGRMILSWGQWNDAVNQHFMLLERLADGYAKSLERIDEQQQQLEASNSGAARGVDAMRMRLLELEGTQDQIAEARRKRDEDEVRRQIALQKLEIERATIRGDLSAVARYQQEIDLLNEQLQLIGLVFNAEKKKAQQDKREGNNGSGGSAGGGIGGGGGITTERTVNNSPTFNVYGITDPKEFARKIQPELKKLDALAR